jgi:rubrerythrin
MGIKENHTWQYVLSRISGGVYMTKKWRCTVCGYIHEGAEPPDECPLCGAPKEDFEEVTDE